LVEEEDAAIEKLVIDKEEFASAKLSKKQHQILEGLKKNTKRVCSRMFFYGTFRITSTTGREN
jgi:hypothetical protein